MAVTDGRFAEAREAVQRMLEAVDGVGDPSVEACAEAGLALIEV
jgi:hypothetical protein